MGKLISSINITIDGFCGHEDAIADDEHHYFSANLLKQADCLLIGRVTYQLFEKFWPSAAENPALPKPIYELAQRLDTIKKVVVSTTLQKAEWKNTSVLNFANSETIDALKNKYTNLLIFGSPGLLTSLTQMGLVDEYYFTVQPIISGKGIKIFDELSLDDRMDLRHVDSKQFASGVVANHYSRK